MKNAFSRHHCAAGLAATIWLCTSSLALDFTLPATTTGAGKLDLGVFNAGESFSLTFSDYISLIEGWDTFADGSVAHSVSAPGFEYANPGANGYPTGFGGDGLNHFPGGGANYDAVLGGLAGFGLTGQPTTDTTDPGTIRLGTVVATFKANPTRTDWFVIGVSNYIVAPSNGVHLYVAVNDTTYGNNTGQYTGKLTFMTPRLQNVRTYAGFEIEGIVALNYRIDYTPSVLPVNWNVLTNIVLPSSPYLFIDTSGPAPGQRFYRAIQTQ